MRLTAKELRERAAQAHAHYADCDLCAHRCHVDRRQGPAGRCYEGTGISLASAGLHFGEEPPLVGETLVTSRSVEGPAVARRRRGSGLVLIGGCNLACRSCETADFSLERRGIVETGELELASLFLDLQARGAANLNLVTPTHVMPALLFGLAAAKERGFELPVVWNCGGYESIEALRLLDGVVDIYLPDVKYGRDAEAESISGSPNYTAAVRESLTEMWRQVGPDSDARSSARRAANNTLADALATSLELDANGLATGGLIARHLVLPNDAAASAPAMQLCASISRDLCVNVMSQYRPLHNARRLPVIARRPSRPEVNAAVQAAFAAGLTQVLLDGKPTSPSAARAIERPSVRTA